MCIRDRSRACKPGGGGPGSCSPRSILQRVWCADAVKPPQPDRDFRDTCQAPSRCVSSSLVRRMRAAGLLEISVIAAIAVILAFWLGYSTNRSGTCVVAAAHEIVHRRRARRVIGLTVASLAAGLVAVPLAWSPVGSVLEGSTDLSITLVIGGVAFGLGALINDACLLGSLGRLGNGESRLLALPLGLTCLLYTSRCV